MIRLVLPRPAARVLMCLALWAALPCAGAAEAWYRIDFDRVEPRADALVVGDRPYAFRRQGGGDPLRLVPGAPGRGQALQLGSGPTPPDADRDRSEVTITSAIEFGREWFLGFSVAIEPGTVFEEGWQVLAQCPQAGTTLRSPPVSVDLEPGGALSLVLRGDADAYDAIWTSPAPVPQGRWVRIVLGFRMGEAGRARLWVDGRQVADAREPLGWAGGDPFCTLKFGVYRGPSARSVALRFDDVILGSDYASAARP